MNTVEIEDVEAELAAEVMKHYKGERTGFVRAGPKGYFLPQKYKQEAGNIYNMAVRPTDIFVASYPRSGTTWTQELVWMVANDLNYAGSDALPLPKRYSFLEKSVLYHPEIYERLKAVNSHSKEKLKLLKLKCQPVTEQLLAAPSPRFLKTHLPLSLLPPTLLEAGKMVYVARDPRDVVVSFYHLNKSLINHGYVGNFDSFWHYFKNNLVLWTPYFEHIKEAWDKRHDPNMLFLFYEELSKDLPAAVRKVSSFLGKQLTEEQVSRLCDHLSFDSFKQNKSFNYEAMRELSVMAADAPFIRQGVVGGWRGYFDEALAADAQRWMEDQLKDTDFRFPHLQL